MSTSYYWRMYDKKKEEAERYEKQIKHLTTTRNRLDSEFDDNVSGINKKLDECANAINEGILNLSAPGRWMDELNQAKERMPHSDLQISPADDYLLQEIRELQRKKQEAEDAAEEYRRLAEAAEAAEAAGI